ncbi:flagellar motor switch protein FliG [Thermodesulfovibrio thiophilus]|uniref:flagellar motor switch protein FliG n=1 Tax=Thermodesulfovibrio thiophilus TaxID=340095 RepID=UPI001832D4C1|nr:flagellar motor switch protein FliG [Thermodesulfovibrio thiophilus]HHW20630.1 flagellar motor switch protein FliG [Thermodesulfovibrio thiophilus]
MRKFSGIEKAAALLSLIGEDAATELFKHFDPIELARILPMMSRIKLTQEEAEAVLKEFSEKIGTAPVTVDEEYIRTILTKAFGEEQAAKLISKIESGASAFDILRWLDPSSIAIMLQREHPQTIAIVLAHLEPTQAAEVLSKFPEQLKIEISQRIANLDQISPTILSELEDVLQSQLSSYTQSRRIGGVKTVAEILNQMDRTSEELIIKHIEEKDPVLADEIRKLMFTFEDLISVDDRGIQTILKEIATDDLVLALKMASEELKEKIFKNMSSRAVQIIKEEMETKGPVRVADVEKAQMNIVRAARRLEEEGKIVVGKRGGEAIVT